MNCDNIIHSFTTMNLRYMMYPVGDRDHIGLFLNLGQLKLISSDPISKTCPPIRLIGLS